VPTLTAKLLLVTVTSAAVAGALMIDVVAYQTFLLLLGSFFVPLFAVLLADWLTAGRHYGSADVFGAPAWRPGLLAAWIADFAVDQWLYPTGPSWWVEVVNELNPPDWGVCATVPSFSVAFALALVATLAARSLSSRRATA
jgi:nucleobase:cation symporter-1, NCS1 family